MLTPSIHNLLLLLLPLLLLLLHPSSTAAATITCHPVRNRGPLSSEALSLFQWFRISCVFHPPHISAESSRCERYSYRRAQIKVCPPIGKDRELWKNGMSYKCSEVASIVKGIIDKCTWDGVTRGFGNFDDAKRGYVNVVPVGE